MARGGVLSLRSVGEAFSLDDRGWKAAPTENQLTSSQLSRKAYSRIWFLGERVSPAEMVRMAGRPWTGHLYSQMPQPTHSLRST